MNEPKYTVKPWVMVGEAGGLEWIIIPETPSDAPPIALVPIGPDRVEQAANGRLITAAPELLESLKKCRDALIRYTDGTETSLYEVTEANLAINKAEGKNG